MRVLVDEIDETFEVTQLKEDVTKDLLTAGAEGAIHLHQNVIVILHPIAPMADGVDFRVLLLVRRALPLQLVVVIRAEIAVAFERCHS